MWDSFISEHPSGTIYHTSMWCKTVEESFGHKPIYLYIKNGKERIKAALPMFLIKSKLTGYRLSTLPCASSCNPVVDNIHDFEILLNFINRFMREHKIRYFELKTDEGFQYNYPLGQTLSKFIKYTLDINKPLEEIKKSMSRHHLRKIKNEGKHDIEVTYGSSLEDLRDFYRLYLRMRKEKGLLPLPWSFFKNLWNNLSSKSQIEIMFAKYNGRTISTLLLLKFKDAVIYEYAATDSKYKRLNPNYLLLWKAIKKVKEEGYRVFDFGRTPKEHKGLADFKRRWGTNQESLLYYYISNCDKIFLSRENILLQRLMNYTIRSVPLSVCHFIGKQLYGHLI